MFLEFLTKSFFLCFNLQKSVTFSIMCYKTLSDTVEEFEDIVEDTYKAFYGRYYHDNQIFFNF